MKSITLLFWATTFVMMATACGQNHYDDYYTEEAYYDEEYSYAEQATYGEQVAVLLLVSHIVMATPKHTATANL